jgi:hypothetical protein
MATAMSAAGRMQASTSKTSRERMEGACCAGFAAAENVFKAESRDVFLPFYNESRLVDIFPALMLMCQNYFSTNTPGKT